MPFVQREFFITEPIKAVFFLSKNFGYSIKQAQKLIDKGRLKAEGVAVKKSQVLYGKVCFNDFVADFYASDELIKPFFTTRNFALFEKPPKLLTHPKGSFLHKSLIDSIRFYLGNTAQPIHRLDYETSGLIVVGTNPKSERELKDIFLHRIVQKVYLAQVKGHITESCIIDAPILSPSRIQKAQKNLSIRSQISPKGKSAQTQIVPLYFDAHLDSTFVKVIPLTGRTHQIRVHLAYIKHPIINDFLYGCDDDISECYLDEIKDQTTQGMNPSHIYANKILCLHSYKLTFCYKSLRYSFIATPPEWFSRSQANDFLAYL